MIGGICLKINLKVRIRNKLFWLALIPAVVAVMEKAGLSLND